MSLVAVCILPRYSRNLMAVLVLILIPAMASAASERRRSDCADVNSLAITNEQVFQLKAKAAQNDSSAMFLIGNHYYQTGDYEVARQWYQDAANRGNSCATKMLSDIHDWTAWVDAKDEVSSRFSLGAFRTRCNNHSAQLQFRLSQNRWVAVEEVPVEFSFGNIRSKYNLKWNGMIEISRSVENCRKLPKGVVKMPLAFQGLTSYKEFTLKDGVATSKLKLDSSGWSMLGLAAVQGLSDYNAARHPGSAPYPSQNPSIGASKQVGLQDEAHYCVKTGAQAEGGMAGQSGGAVLLVQNACNRAITISLCASGPTYKPHWHCSDGFGLSPGQSNFSHSYTYGWHCKSSSCGDIQVVWNAVYEDSGIQPKKPDVDNSGQDSVQ